MRFFVSYSHSCLKQKALSLSKKLNLEPFDHLKINDIASFSNDYFLVCTSERLILKKIDLYRLKHLGLHFPL